MSTPGKIRWTPEQLRGITTTGHNLLVSAAAGSGKTAVLAARCAYLVCDAPEPCDVDQLLVVTFTEAAAAEMKSRIESSLRESLVGREDARLEQQLALVERAQVSTLHGFCAKLLRQNFHLLGLDPAFEMLDQDEQSLLKNEIAREMVAARYDDDAQGLFARLVDWYGQGDDELLIPHILALHEMLCSIIDVRGWVHRACARINEAAAAPRLETSELGRELLATLDCELAALLRRCRNSSIAITTSGGPAPYAQYLLTLAQLAQDWIDLLHRRGINALAGEVLDAKLPRRPTVKDAPGRDMACAMVEDIQKQFRDGPLHAIAAFNVAQWQAGLKSIAPMVELLLELVMDFGRRYRKAKQQSGKLDFSDLERRALEILRDQAHASLAPSGVAKACHKHFRHVLVDEYQDINQVQDAILHLVSRECVAGQPGGGESNLFCVGDVKQSIYRFRLAEPTRFLERYAAYKQGVQGSEKQNPESRSEKREEGADHRQLAPGNSSHGEVIDLQANFRSRGPLLDAINQFFNRMMTGEAAEIEYDTAQELRPGADYPAGGEHCFTGAPIELHLLPDEVGNPDPDEEEPDRSEREAGFVAMRIRQLMGLDGGQPMKITVREKEAWATRAVRFSDIVILLRSMKVRADQYAAVLRAAGIPVFRDGGGGFFDSMEVRDVLSLLQLLDNQQQDIPMAAVLRSPLSGLADPEDGLARIRLAYPAAEVPFHEAVVRYSAEHGDELGACLRDFLEQLARWRDVARHRPLAELIWTIYDQTGYLGFCEGLADGAQRAANLIELHSRAGQFGTFSRQGLYRFLKFLQSLEAETDYGQPSVLSQAADVVRIMSVHRSKGLEFPVVFVPELGKGINFQSCSGAIIMDRATGLGLSAVDESLRIRYPSLASVLVQQSLKRQSLAEEMRILYVAMTRAKEHLVLSGTSSENKFTKWQSLWSGAVGKLPAAEVLCARSVLDWVGPVSQMIGPAGAVTVTWHTPEEVAQWSGPQLRRPSFSPLQEALAQLKPLTPAPPKDACAAETIARLTASYPHAALAAVEAVKSVTAWTKKGRQAEAGYVSGGSLPGPGVRFDRTLETPRCLLRAGEMSAADIGTATHLLLQYLDFSRPCSGEDLESQIIRTVDRRLVTPAQARAVDREAIAWLASTPLGAILRQRQDQVSRELEFHFGQSPQAFDAAPVDQRDVVMIRGRIDAMVIEADGLTVIDYKTDRVAGEMLAQRIDFYRPQVKLYREAMETITGSKVKAVYLVFLHARQVVEVD